MLVAFVDRLPRTGDVVATEFLELLEQLPLLSPHLHHNIRLELNVALEDMFGRMVDSLERRAHVAAESLRHKSYEILECIGRALDGN